MRAIIGKHQKRERFDAPRAAALKMGKFVAKCRVSRRRTRTSSAGVAMRWRSAQNPA
jgi:hypothetical protein